MRNDVYKWRHASKTKQRMITNVFQMFISLFWETFIVKTKYKGLQRKLRSKIIKNDKMTSLNDVICPAADMVCKKLFSKYYFYHIQQLQQDRLVVSKTKFKGWKWQLSSNINEEWLNDISKWRHMSESGHDIHMHFFQSIPLIILNNFNHDDIVVKT